MCLLFTFAIFVVSAMFFYVSAKYVTPLKIIRMIDNYVSPVNISKRPESINQRNKVAAQISGST